LERERGECSGKEAERLGDVPHRGWAVGRRIKREIATEVANRHQNFVVAYATGAGRHLEFHVVLHAYRGREVLAQRTRTEAIQRNDARSAGAFVVGADVIDSAGTDIPTANRSIDRNLAEPGTGIRPHLKITVFNNRGTADTNGTSSHDCQQKAQNSQTHNNLVSVKLVAVTTLASYQQSPSPRLLTAKSAQVVAMGGPHCK
jgi:hypothetical protein